jgi:hypothetical protein
MEQQASLIRTQTKNLAPELKFSSVLTVEEIKRLC